MFVNRNSQYFETYIEEKFYIDRIQLEFINIVENIKRPTFLDYYKVIIEQNNDIGCYYLDSISFEYIFQCQQRSKGCDL